MKLWIGDDIGQVFLERAVRVSGGLYNFLLPNKARSRGPLSSSETQEAEMKAHVFNNAGFEFPGRIYNDLEPSDEPLACHSNGHFRLVHSVDGDRLLVEMMNHRCVLLEE